MLPKAYQTNWYQGQKEVLIFGMGRVLAVLLSILSIVDDMAYVDGEVFRDQEEDPILLRDESMVLGDVKRSSRTITIFLLNYY